MTGTPRKFSTYLSHSWRPEDVALNESVWRELVRDCVVSVDSEGAERKQAYFVNRLEEYIRRADLFVSVLTWRPPSEDEEGLGKGDFRIHCSAAALFEVRLAERARKPRWVLFDDRTRFRPPISSSGLVRYSAFDLEEVLREPRILAKEFQLWMGELRHEDTGIVPRLSHRRDRALVLLDPDDPERSSCFELLRDALRDAHFSDVQLIEPQDTDSEILSMLQAAGLLVADLGGSRPCDEYIMAHALFTPTIRIRRSDRDGVPLPRLLDGHPGGYQHDVVYWSTGQQLRAGVLERACAMRDRRRPLSEESEGLRYLRQRQFRPGHLVFLSHNVPVEQKASMAKLFGILDERGLRAWEYRHENVSGEIWRDRLAKALDDATDLVLVMSDEYEKSEACHEELKTMAARREDLGSVLAFTFGDRHRPTPEFAALHHEHVDLESPEAIQRMADRICDALRV